MKVIEKKLTKVLYHPKSNPGINNQVIISSDGMDTAREIFVNAGIEYVGSPVYLPVVDAYITDEIEATMTDATAPESEKPKKGKDKE